MKKSEAEKIKLYADENIPREVVEFMRESLQWDVRWVCEEERLKEKSDTYHHRRARTEGRIILTRDRDYLDPVRFPYHKTGGIITVREKNTKRIIKILGVFSPLFEKFLAEGKNLSPFFKMVVSSSGVSIRYQKGEGKIGEDFYPWKKIKQIGSQERG